MTTQVLEAGSRPALPFRRYVAAMWRFRHFTLAMARAQQRADQSVTWLGPVWSIIDPLLLACVYYVLIALLRGGDLAGSGRLGTIIGGIFLYSYTRSAVSGGARSILRNEKLLMNASFPRALLPSSEVVLAARHLAAGLLVYAVVHVVLDRPITANLLLMGPLLFVHTLFNLGLALLIGMLTAYVPDMQNAVGYGLRIWLYLTPVLYSVQDLEGPVRAVLVWNPLYPLFSSYQQVLDGRTPSLPLLLAAVTWALAALLVGWTSFTRKEREFAVRL